METFNFDELQNNPRNPRIIKDREFQKLKKLLKEFGDLGLIVKNVETGTLVGGNQRLAAFREFDGPKGVQILERFDPALKDGTVAVGRVIVDGTGYGYREVRWTKAKETAAIYAANHEFAQNDPDMTAELLYEIQQADESMLAMTGFDDKEIEKLLASAGVGDSQEPPEEPENNELVFKLTPDQSELVMQVMDAVKRSNNITNSDNGSALYILAQQWLVANPQAASEPDDLLASV